MLAVRTAPAASLLRMGADKLGWRSFTQSISAVIPPNLKLADEAVLKEPPKPIVPEIQYNYPVLEVPETIPVAILNEPGKFLESPAKLERKIFEVALRKDIVHNCVRHTRHARRQPHKTKRIFEISGSNKKPRPQKGTGVSQVGNKRNSAWRGGQKAHGPVLRDYSISINRKTRALGMMISLTARLREGNLIIFDQLETEVLILLYL